MLSLKVFMDKILELLENEEYQNYSVFHQSKKRQIFVVKFLLVTTYILGSALLMAGIIYLTNTELLSLKAYLKIGFWMSILFFGWVFIIPFTEDEYLFYDKQAMTLMSIFYRKKQIPKLFKKYHSEMLKVNHFLKSFSKRLSKFYVELDQKDFIKLINLITINHKAISVNNSIAQILNGEMPEIYHADRKYESDTTSKIHKIIKNVYNRNIQHRQVEPFQPLLVPKTNSIIVPKQFENNLEVPTNTKRKNKVVSIGHVRWEELNAKRKNIGDLGELIAIEFEKQKLINLGLQNEINRIVHVSKENGDGYGYDIESIDSRLKTIYIEVKTTISNQNAPIYISLNEYNVMRSYGDQYFLYRIYSLNEATSEAKIEIFEGFNSISNAFNFETSALKGIRNQPNKLSEDE